MLLCMSLFFVAFPVRSLAGSETQPIGISANVPKVCSLNSTTPAVVEYDPIGTNLTTDLRELLGTITITCNAAKTAIFNPDHGLHGLAQGAYFQNRLYAYPNSQYLNYGIYQDANYASLFGTTSTANGTSGGTSESVAVAAGVPQPLNVYLDIPAGQNQSPGLYSDQIFFTVTY
jgi:spore coat protein U-like protein